MQMSLVMMAGWMQWSSCEEKVTYQQTSYGATQPLTRPDGTLARDGGTYGSEGPGSKGPE